MPVATIPFLAWSDRFVRHMRPCHLRFLCFLLLLVIGYVDYLTGVEASLSIFYLFPVACMAWYYEGWLCVGYAVALPVIWGIANYLAGDSSGPAIIVWNGTVRTIFFSSVCVLIKQLKAALEREHELSHRDHLTGLLNRRAFTEILRSEYSRCQRSGSSLGLAYVDLDHFKELNDRLGHAEGDHALTEVAQLLHNQLRLCDAVARLGGDEFAILVPGSTVEGAQTIAERLVTSVKNLSAQKGWPLTASIGFVVLEKLGREDSSEMALKLSDNLMYQVKQAGRDGFQILRHPEDSVPSVKETPVIPSGGPILRKQEVEVL